MRIDEALGFFQETSSPNNNSNNNKNISSVWGPVPGPKSNLIGWRQTLTTSSPNHIRCLLVRVKKIAKWKTGLRRDSAIFKTRNGESGNGTGMGTGMEVGTEVGMAIKKRHLKNE